MKTGNFIHALAISLIFLAWSASAQEASIILGESKIGLNQPFTITVQVDNGRLRDYGAFPDIKGLYKRGTSSSSSTNIINGKMSTSQSITQNYFAEAQGTFKLAPFSMQINGKAVNSPGATITVGPEVQQNNAFDPFSSNPFQDMFGDQQPQQYLDLKADAFLALTTDKDEVYVGQGFTTILAFYISEDNRAPLQFYDPAQQLSKILKVIKPPNCWEENFNIENITPEQVNVNGKLYSRYKIYEAAYYPLNADTIRFPVVPFKMIKYKVAKNPTFFGNNKIEDYKTFYTKEKTVMVKPLPPFPLRDQVAVGNYRLREKLGSGNQETGQSFEYDFIIEGEGNIAGIDQPPVKSGDVFQVYPPDMKQNINRSGDHVTGTKSFEYYIIPNEPGQYDLGRFFYWIFFNTARNRYDTLRSQLAVNVTGESRKNEKISDNDVGTFYDQTEIEDNQLASLHGHDWIRYVTNVFIVIMIGISIYVIFKSN